MEKIWVFTAPGNGTSSYHLPSGAFTTSEQAEEWIHTYKLTGILIAYPINYGTLDWAIEHASNERERRMLEKRRLHPAFIASFASNMQEYHEYDRGRRVERKI
ncbi:MAG: hypothetical protein GFH27_549279n287 [Chloroflexi bacterium AL-W]|nr:hypothetical protein [Chloroflexi bacterium AL-N1]NOK65253.1 hypothetical protein [Chloroflexi bacterium AL-N10]NOK72482.1 hypothetical protein [Chloroflexi bacterium AL-N5]NOK79432.1 hypothetical protein [Chloroflexi bacterium AL-W]NOK87348.1 hypothetical protein [Chloroflexi bacterium AL-N15]